jgi:hypothetical protein
MRDSQLDRLIDETARALTEAAVPDDLRRMVQQSITAPARRVRPLAMAVAAASVVALGVTVTLWRAEDISPRAVDTTTVLPQAIADTSTPRPQPADAPATVPQPSRAVAVATDTTPGGPLPPLQPIAVERVSIELLGDPPPPAEQPLEVQLLTIPMPFRAERIEVEALVLE